MQPLKVHFAQVQLHSFKPDLELAYSSKKQCCEPVGRTPFFLSFGAFYFLILFIYISHAIWSSDHLIILCSDIHPPSIPHKALDKSESIAHTRNAPVRHYLFDCKTHDSY